MDQDDYLLAILHSVLLVHEPIFPIHEQHINEHGRVVVSMEEICHLPVLLPNSTVVIPSPMVVKAVMEQIVVYVQLKKHVQLHVPAAIYVEK